MWTCPKCERPLTSPNQFHYCVKVATESLFEGKPPPVLALFEQLCAEVTNWPDVRYSATKNCVVFVQKKTFLIVRPMKKELDLKFYLDYEDGEFPIYKSIERSGKYETYIRLAEEEDLEEIVFKLIKRSYEL